jgi:hypothetical protein
VTEAVLGFMQKAGFDPYFGRRMIHELRAAGLEDVRAEGRVRLIEGGGEGSDFYRLSLASLGPALVESGALGQAELDQALADVDDPGNVYLSPVMVAAWGRRTG